MIHKKITVSTVRDNLCPNFLLIILAIIALIMLLYSLSNSVLAQSTTLKTGDVIPQKIWDMALLKVTPSKEIPFELSTLKGTPLIIDFWAYWCAPCLRKMPHLDSLYRIKNNKLGLIMIEVSYKGNTAPKVRQTVAELFKANPTFASNIILKNDEFLSYFDVQVVPHYLWVGSDGIIRAMTGFQEVTEDNIDLFLAGKNIVYNANTFEK